jgi:hypothetical protein
MMAAIRAAPARGIVVTRADLATPSRMRPTVSFEGPFPAIEESGSKTE